jgi:hypothetical protein
MKSLVNVDGPALPQGTKVGTYTREKHVPQRKLTQALKPQDPNLTPKAKEIRSQQQHQRTTPLTRQLTHQYAKKQDDAGEEDPTNNQEISNHD